MSRLDTLKQSLEEELYNKVYFCEVKERNIGMSILCMHTQFHDHWGGADCNTCPLSTQGMFVTLLDDLDE